MERVKQRGGTTPSGEQIFPLCQALCAKARASAAGNGARPDGVAFAAFAAELPTVTPSGPCFPADASLHTLNTGARYLSAVRILGATIDV
jgi:hypothetical protein